MKGTFHKNKIKNLNVPCKSFLLYLTIDEFLEFKDGQHYAKGHDEAQEDDGKGHKVTE